MVECSVDTITAVVQILSQYYYGKANKGTASDMNGYIRRSGKSGRRAATTMGRGPEGRNDGDVAKKVRKCEKGNTMGTNWFFDLGRPTTTLPYQCTDWQLKMFPHPTPFQPLSTT